MKKGLIVVLALLLMLSLTGCGDTKYVEVPEIKTPFSDEFMNTFLDNYSVRDPHLYYYTAEEYGGIISEYDVRRKIEKEIDGWPFELRLAKIDDADMGQFVLGTRYRYQNLGPLGSTQEAFHYVYSHKDAPDPIKDWTVKSIELYTASEHQDYNSHVEVNNEYEYDQGFGLYLKKEGQLLYSWANNEDNKDFISDVVSTLNSEYKTTARNEFNSANMGVKLFQLSPIVPAHEYTYIVISFQECSGIVWISNFIKYEEDCFKIAKYDSHNKPKMRDSGTLINLSWESSVIFDTVFNTLVTVDPKPSTLPTCSDFEKITEGMTYEEVVSVVGLPHKMSDGTTIISVNYNTVEGKEGLIYFTRRRTGELIVANQPSYEPNGFANETD
ncbi:MAG: hypothetical protein E7670_06140 [Ruminococcaceae bacterium]|nr:hypothetical protein [Oscillospiraceae bacterium]